MIFSLQTVIDESDNGNSGEGSSSEPGSPENNSLVSSDTSLLPSQRQEGLEINLYRDN